MAPVIPGLNDEEIEAIAAASAEAGARSIGYVLLRLPYEVKDLFREWLDTHAPEKAGRVMKLIRDMRGGKDYDWSGASEKGHRTARGSAVAALRTRASAAWSRQLAHADTAHGSVPRPERGAPERSVQVNRR
jgi:DNA repair photolyase